MVQELVIRELCDICLRVKGEKVDAVWSEEIKVGRLVRVLALCEEDKESTADPFLEALRSWGIKPEREHSHNGNDTGHYACDVPGCRYPPAKTPQGLGSHKWRVHGVHGQSRQASSGDVK